jgi:Sec-independent protein translocase protein TatA
VDFLSPAKLLVIAVVALAVLGPDKLPKLAKQIGGLWRDFSRFREKMESDVRGSFPDLPSTETITKAVRSPLAFLDTLVDAPTSADATGPDAAGVSTPASADDAPEAEHLADGTVEAELPSEFDPATEVHWPTDTVTASDVDAEELPVLVTPAGGVVHEVRPHGGYTPDDPGSN